MSSQPAQSTDALPNVYRHYSGVGIEGKRITLLIYPEQGTARFRFKVLASPVATGFDGLCSLGDSEARTIYFSRDDIKINGFELICLASTEVVPEYREGFSLILEQGMPELVNTWLPLVGKAGFLSNRIHEAYCSHTGKPLNAEPYYRDLIGEMAALVTYELPHEWDVDKAVIHLIDPSRVSDKESLEKFRAFLLSQQVKDIVAIEMKRGRSA